jgi:hypothetical protein
MKTGEWHSRGGNGQKTRHCHCSNKSFRSVNINLFRIISSPMNCEQVVESDTFIWIQNPHRNKTEQNEHRASRVAFEAQAIHFISGAVEFQLSSDSVLISPDNVPVNGN